MTRVPAGGLSWSGEKGTLGLPYLTLRWAVWQSLQDSLRFPTPVKCLAVQKAHLKLVCVFNSCIDIFE